MAFAKPLVFYPKLMRYQIIFAALLPILLGLPLQTQAGVFYDFNPAYAAVYQQILQLELDGAEEALATLRRAHPRNLAADHLGSYLDFFGFTLPKTPPSWPGYSPSESNGWHGLKNCPTLALGATM
ncbi:MAG: hypothetical protein HC821_01655 [Lewinella sp.]|nr:hypothetical protein [Lewinella sp.]